MTTFLLVNKVKLIQSALIKTARTKYVWLTLFLYPLIFSVGRKIEHLLEMERLMGDFKIFASSQLIVVRGGGVLRRG